MLEVDFSISVLTMFCGGQMQFLYEAPLAKLCIRTMIRANLLA